MSERRQTKDERSVKVVDMERAGKNKTVGDVILCSQEIDDQFTRVSRGCMGDLQKLSLLIRMKANLQTL